MVDWITLNKTGSSLDDQIIIVPSINTSIESRAAYLVISGYGISKQIYVYQDGMAQDRYIIYSGTSQISVPSSGWSSSGSSTVLSATFSGGSGIITFDNVADYFPYQAFLNETGLTSITVPTGLTSMSTGVFMGCSNLVSVNGLEDLDHLYFAGSNGEQFKGCSSLTSIGLPANVSGQTYALGPNMFSGCSSLVTINYAGTKDQWRELVAHSTWRDNSSVRYVRCSNGLIDLDEPNDIIIYESPYKEADIESSGSGIHVNAFTPVVSAHTYADGTGILHFGDDVTSVGYEAFYGCSGITEIVLPETVTSISSRGFMSCNNLETVNLPEELTHLGTYAFSYCSNLQSVTIPSGITTIETHLFAACTSMSSITLPYAVNINDYAFSACTALESVTVSSGLTYIGQDVFNGCTNLTTIVYPALSGRWRDVTLHENWRNNSAIRYIQCIDRIIDLDAPVDVVIYYAPEQLEIETSAFTPTITAHTFSNGVGRLESSSPITAIKDSAFYNQSTMTRVDIPSTVESLGTNCFYGCTSLEAVNIGYNSNLTTLGGCVFSYCSSLLSFVVPNRITNMGYSTFSYCSSLTDVYYEDEYNISTIGDYAFRGCSSLTGITVPVNCSSMGSYAFAYSGIKNVFVPNANYSSDGYQFAYCNGITAVTFGTGSYSIPKGMFTCATGGTGLNITAKYTGTDANYDFDSKNLGDSWYGTSYIRPGTSVRVYKKTISAIQGDFSTFHVRNSYNGK